MDNYNNQTFDVSSSGSNAGSGKTLAIVSLVLAILGFLCCGWIATIPALICGIISYRKESNGLALAAIIISGVCTVIGIFSFIFITVPMLTGMLANM